jgi:uncharacterized caspase-like protein
MKFKPNVIAIWSYDATKNIAKKVSLACAITCTAGSLGLPPAALAQAAKPASGKEADRNLQVVAAPAAAFPGQSAGRRVALVIGNSAYKESPLLNPVNDARAISAAFTDSGFTVISRENIDQRGMLSALREFGDKLRDGGVGIFYYAGHGMQIKGRNYLIPVGASIEREDEVAYSAVDAQAVLDKMEAAGNGTNIMILDACRNNPFTRSTRSGQAGLAQMDAPVGTLVAFATSPGAVASDGGGQNGLYTQHLLTAMRQQGAKVEDVFKQVRANVRRDSQGKQVPWESTSLEGDFYFKVPAGLAASTAPSSADGAANAAVEAALWDAVKNSTLAVEVRAYVGRYPNGRYLREANARIAQLTGAPVVANNSIANNNQPTLTSASNSAKIPPASNSFGQTVGDRWRYQIVDKFKGEVASNYSLQIDRIEANGDLVINKGGSIFDPRGNAKFTRNAERERTYTNYFNYPPEFKVGAKFDIAYEVDNKLTSGSVNKEISKGTMLVKGQERVKTPAGEFEAWVVERNINWRNPSSNSGGTFTLTGWYVPQLRRYVAWDEESRNSNGTFNRRERHELTSFSVAGADNLALR